MTEKNQYMAEVAEELIQHPLFHIFAQLIKSGKSREVFELYELQVEEIMKSSPMQPVCKKGCSMCCTLNVDISDFEKSFIKEGFDKLPEKLRDKVVEIMKTKHQKTKKLDMNERSKRRMMCGFNVDGNCSIYENRPLSCRSHHSLDIQACIDGNEENSDVVVQQASTPIIIKQMIDMAEIFTVKKGDFTLESFVSEL